MAVIGGGLLDCALSRLDSVIEEPGDEAYRVSQKTQYHWNC